MLWRILGGDPPPPPSLRSGATEVVGTLQVLAGTLLVLAETLLVLVGTLQLQVFPLRRRWLTLHLPQGLRGRWREISRQWEALTEFKQLKDKEPDLLHLDLWRSGWEMMTAALMAERRQVRLRPEAAATQPRRPLLVVQTLDLAWEFPAEKKNPVKRHAN